MAEGDEGSGDGAAMASDAVAAGDLAFDELEVGVRRAGEGGRTAGLDGLGPGREVVAAGNGRDGLAIEVTMAKAEEMGTTHAETDGGLGGVEGTGVEGVEGAMDEVLGQAVADLALFFATGHSSAPGAA